MGVTLLEVGVEIRKFVIFSVRRCYRSACRHPFLVGIVFFLIFLYRSFPFVFSLLISASPVLVSTAVLLGTLLSFGQPNIPEIEKEENTTHEIVSLKTEVSRDSTVVERDGSGSYSVERYTEKGRDVVEKSNDETISIDNTMSEVDKDDSPPLAEVKSREFVFGKESIEEPERDLHETGFEQNGELNEDKLDDGEVLENHYSPIKQLNDENLDSDMDKSLEGSIGSPMGVRLNSPPGSPWKRRDDNHDVDEDDEDEESDSGSDGAESSSPDASLADIIPLLDELHPLLDEDAPQPAPMSHNGSDAGSEHSSKSSESGHGSHEELEVGDDEEEEEETHVDKEDGTKSAITWTEDDQKNLMNLGTSELERNQRLENLIARRRARKNMRLMAEKNLIDLESTDLPFNVAPISTTRHNPFDFPFDFNDNVPGSAPSILLPRRNPFDLPYDSSEEKPDLVGDTLQQDFVTFQTKEPLFRRHESFNVGPSIFGAVWQERQETRFRPYFVPERMGSEETNYSSFQRQSSELSESKASSLPETDSVLSEGDVDEDKDLIEEEFSQERELIPNIDHASEHIGHGSETSEDVDSVELGRVEGRNVDHNETEMILGDVSSLCETGSVANPVELDTNEVHLNTEAVEHKFSSGSSSSSSSSSSEANEEIFNEKDGEDMPSLEPRRENLIEETGISNETQHKEPVYDSSPQAIKKNLSSLSDSSDLQVQIPEMGSPPAIVKRSISFAEREYELGNLGIEYDTLDSEEALVVSSELNAEDENKLGSRLVTEVTEHGVKKYGLSGFDQVANEEEFSASTLQFEANEDQNLALPDEEHSSAVEQVSHDQLDISSLETESIKENLMDKEEALQFDHDQVHSSNPDGNYHVGIHQEEDEKLVSSEEVMSQSEKELHVFDKSMDQSSDNPQELKEQLITQMESSDEPSTSYNLNALEAHDLDNKVQPNISIESTDEYNTLDKVEIGRDQIPDIELTDAHVDVQNDNDDADEIKEIDEGLLMELDTVGDFSVKNTQSNSNEIEESFLVMRDNETNSFGSAEDDFVEIHEINGVKTEEIIEHGSREFVVGEVENPMDLQSDNEPQLAEKTEVGPADSGVQHIPNANPVDLQSGNNEPQLPEKTEVGPSDSGAQHNPTAEEINSGMHVLEASSLEDIDSAFKEINEREIEKPIAVESIGDGPDLVETPDVAEIPSQVNVTKRRLQEDTNVAVNQVSESNTTEKVSKSDSEDGPAQIEADEVDSSKCVESGTN